MLTLCEHTATLDPTAFALAFVAFILVFAAIQATTDRLLPKAKE